MMLLHVTTETEWAAAQAAGELRGEPFLHLCTEAQLPFVLETHFPDQTGLLVLQLDPAGLDVRWEESEPGMAAFPHLYGGIGVEGLTEVRVA